MTDTPENPTHADAPPTSAVPPVPSPARALPLPSTRASAVLAAAMLPAGLMGDRYGHKRVFLISLALFATGSAALPPLALPAGAEAVSPP